MTSSMLVPCLAQLKKEFDRLYPNRGHASDGDIGDLAHQQEVSDHNDDEVGKVPIHDADHVHEVHALDVDNDLDGAGPVDTETRMELMERCVQFILSRCRSGAEKRLRYIIYDFTIWEASTRWRARPYTGVSPHTEHAHFSSSYDTDLEASTASWHLEDIPVAMTDADKLWFSNEIARQITEACRTVPFAAGGGAHSLIGDAVLNSSYPSRDGETRSLVWFNLQRMQQQLDQITLILQPKPE